MNSEAVVIVGGGLAGAKTAEYLREASYSGPITLIADEVVRPYERPPLSKDYLLGKAELEGAFVHSEAWYFDHDVDLRLGARAVGIDLAEQKVRLVTGTDVPYRKLVLATGSRPRPLPVPGADLTGVHYLRTMDDARVLRGLLETVNKIAIIGGGWIGLEVAAAARSAGVEVTLLEAADMPLQGVLGPEVAGIFARLHVEHGVDLRTNVTVESFLLGEDHVAGVWLADGTQVAADAVVVGVGITPNVELALGAGLAVDNGIVVDESLRTTNPDVFAVGDVANAWHPQLNRRIRVEHWANALNQPRVAALGAIGQAAIYDRLPYFFTDQYDLGMEYVGYTSPGEYDSIVFRGDPQTREFIAFWLKRDWVVAGMNVNVWDVADDIREIVSSRRSVDPVLLADPNVPLSEV